MQRVCIFFKSEVCSLCCWGRGVLVTVGTCEVGLCIHPFDRWQKQNTSCTGSCTVFFFSSVLITNTSYHSAFSSPELTGWDFWLPLFSPSCHLLMTFVASHAWCTPEDIHPAGKLLWWTVTCKTLPHMMRLQIGFFREILLLDWHPTFQKGNTSSPALLLSLGQLQATECTHTWQRNHLTWMLKSEIPPSLKMPSEYFQQTKGQSRIFHVECKFLFWSAFKG